MYKTLIDHTQLSSIERAINYGTAFSATHHRIDKCGKYLHLNYTSDVMYNERYRPDTIGYNSN